MRCLMPEVMIFVSNCIFSGRLDLFVLSLVPVLQVLKENDANEDQRVNLLHSGWSKEQ